MNITVRLDLSQRKSGKVVNDSGKRIRPADSFRWLSNTIQLEGQNEKRGISCYYRE
jgi:hypothetical protein